MRKYSFKYFTQKSLRSLVRNGFMSAASILTLSLCLLVIGSFGLLVYNIYVNLNELDGLNEIVCMCDYDLEDGKEKEIEEAIKKLNNVESITFVSKEEAFEEQIKQYAAFPQILEYFENKSEETKAPVVTEPAIDLPTEEATEPDSEELTQDIETEEITETVVGGDTEYEDAPAEDSEASEETVSGEGTSEESATDDLSSEGTEEAPIEDTEAVTDVTAETDDVVTEEITEEVTEAVTDAESDSDIIPPASNRDKNPLSDAFKVVYKDINGITELRDRLSAIDGIRSVKDAADAAQSLQNLKDTIMIIFAGFMLALIFVSLVIIAFTISMAVSTREKEVLVMRYVGATSFFISFPFVLESLFIGLIATVISYGVQYGLYGYLCNILLNSGQEVASFISVAPFSEVWLPTLIAFLAVALLTCYVGCKVTLAKKVKV